MSVLQFFHSKSTGIVWHWLTEHILEFRCFNPSPLYVLALFVCSCDGNSQDAVQKTVRSCLFSTAGLPSVVSCGGRRG